MAVSGLLAQYMAVKNQLDYCHQQQTRWNNMATAMSKKLSTQTSAEEKWESSSENAFNDFKTTKEFKAHGEILQDKEGILQGAYKGLNREQFAETYASKAVPKFDSELLEEYTELDMEYSTMQSMYDTLCTELEAQEQSLKDQLGKDAQDTHMLSS